MPIILGQPTVGDWALTIHITCPCGGTFLWMGRPGVSELDGSICACPTPGCRRIFRIKGMPTMTPEGLIEVSLRYGKLPT